MYQGKYGDSHSLFGRQTIILEYFDRKDHLDSEEFEEEVKEEKEDE